MENTLGLYVAASRGTKQAVLIVSCLVVFYPLVLLLNGSIKAYKTFKKLNLVLIVSSLAEKSFVFPFSFFFASLIRKDINN